MLVAIEPLEDADFIYPGVQRKCALIIANAIYTETVFFPDQLTFQGVNDLFFFQEIFPLVILVNT